MRQRISWDRAQSRSTVTSRRSPTSCAGVASSGSASSRYRPRDILRASSSRRRFPRPSAANAFVDPRNISATTVSPTRVERSVPLKALVSQINYNLFDVEVGAQQSQFAFLQAKDLADAVDGLMRTHDSALWNGNDTSLSAPTTSQYYGAAGQIAAGGNVATVAHDRQHRGWAEGDGRADGGELFVRSSPDGDLCEPGAARSDRSRNEVAIQRGAFDHGSRGGLRVKTLSTQAGELPLIPEWTLGYTGTPGRVQRSCRHTSCREDMIEYHWLTDPNPRVFQLGLSGSLASQLVVVKFGAVVVKGASYAHYKVTVQR